MHSNRTLVFDGSGSVGGGEVVGGGCGGTGWCGKIRWRGRSCRMRGSAGVRMNGVSMS